MSYSRGDLGLLWLCVSYSPHDDLGLLWLFKDCCRGASVSVLQSVLSEGGFHESLERKRYKHHIGVL